MKIAAQARRIRRVRSTIVGSVKRPRLAVFRSNKHISAQLVDDENGHTLLAATDAKMAKKTKTEKAVEVGKKLAEQAKKKGIRTVVFDRRQYQFHGRVAALAKGAREAGLEF